MKYKEKLEEAKKLYASANADQKYVLESLFPELAGLKDDETLRKNLIKAFNTVGGRHWGGLEVRKILTWLEKQEREDYNPYKVIIESIAEMCERYSHTTDWKDFYDNVKVKCKDAIEYDKANPEKQGKQKSIIKMKTPEESLGIDSDTYNEIVDVCIYDEQKPDDKVEPKFHKGDWIVFNGLTLYVEEVVRSFYRTVSIDGNYSSYDWNIDSSARLWTLKDAKDGDVLYAGGSHCYFKEYIFMFSSFTEDNVMSTHFGYDVFHGTFDKDITRFGREEDFMFVTPATKKRRELLFQKMKENDYELDSEKKELKKILITPRFEIGDVLCDKSCTTLDKKSQPNFEIIDIRNNMYICDNCSFPIYQQDEYELVAKKIKQYSTWSEEDEKMVKDIIAAIDTLHYHGMVNWLKSLKQRYTWKPSEEQYEALDYAHNSCPDTERGNYYEGVLEDLIEDLHKLSETQGEKPQGKTSPEAAKEEKVDNQSCVEPIDEAEPKFHEGEWITNGDYTWKIVEVKPLDYILQSQGGNIVDDTISHVDEQFHSFTIEDAKEGDVLAYVTDEGDLWIMIYRPLYEPYEGHVHYHALLVNDNFSVKGTCCISVNNLKPATKKQFDTLFAKMKEAGYEWDAEKKEPKKIEQPELTEFEDAVKDLMNDYRDAIGDCDATTEEVKKYAAYMLSLIPPKPTVGWRPSEEQMDALETAVSSLQSNTLETLYQDLKRETNYE